MEDQQGTVSHLKKQNTKKKTTQKKNPNQPTHGLDLACLYTTQEHTSSLERHTKTQHNAKSTFSLDSSRHTSRAQ